MTEITTADAKSSIRLRFFEMLFSDTEGFVCVATTDPRAPKVSFNQFFFKWPQESMKMENWILKVERKYNVYFCVNLLTKKERKKDNCQRSSILWADLDSCNPDTIDKIPPPIVIRSSPGRWQAIWRMTTQIPAYQAEDYSRRIAYSLGADVSGWDLTQLLRIPLTLNFKYDTPAVVELQRALETKAPPLIFEGIPATIKRGQGFDILEVPMPENGNTAQNADQVIYKYGPLLQRTAFFSLFTQDPEEGTDWSSVLWRLLHECFRVGMTTEEVFVLAREAKCNKYMRDGRPIEHLWRDVLKAAESHLNIDSMITELISMPTLVEAPHSRTIIDEYREWGMEATDAVPAFHDLSMFVVLSAIVSNSVRIETSAGLMTPNIWGLILGDSTLTRKTTAMRLAMDFLIQMDPTLILATDGTAEGLLTGLSTRPNKASVFHKDEVSGFFESMARKEYMAGMQETLTALYDVPPIYTRMLRKEVIILESPSFVFLGGGVSDRVYASVDESFVLSGFLPRFLVVSGDAKVEDRRPLGPPTDAGVASKPQLQVKLADLFENYAIDQPSKIGGQTVMQSPRVVARLTPGAWQLNASFETTMLNTANNSLLKDLALPTLDRMSRSLLKMGTILAATRQKPINQEIVVEEGDLINAAWYVQQWGQNSINLIINAGKGQHEKVLERVHEFIKERPGALRAEIMRRFHLDSKTVAAVMQTLEERGLVTKEQRGRGHAFWIT